MTSGSYCLASRRVLEGAAIGLMYRERKFSADDSGWRFFAGDETGEYTADPRNVLMTPLADVVSQHPHVATWLDQPIGVALERNARGELQPCS